MTYKKAKKIFPGNWSIPLNGWYQNIDTDGDSTTTEGSKGGPTSVLSVPGWRYFQTYGYAVVDDTTAGTSAARDLEVIVPSPYKNDDTRPNIEGLTIAASAAEPAYIYRVSLSVGDDWLADTEQAGSRKTADVYIPSGQRLCINIDNAGSPTSNAEQGPAYAELTTGSGNSLATVITAGTSATSSVPLVYQGQAPTLTSGVNYAGAVVNLANGTISGTLTTSLAQTPYYRATSNTKFKVFVKSAATDAVVSASGGATITTDDYNAGRRGYVLVEICYMRPDTAVSFSDLDPYIAYPNH